MTAYVLIQKRPDSQPVARTIRAVRGIVEAEDITGAYDAIAVAEAGSSRDLYDRVLPQLREIPGVTQVLPAPLGDPGTAEAA
jgi:DNA-binding Lrp family transcriptional regulator